MAPVWVDTLTERTVALLKRSQSLMAVGVIRGHRTFSYGAACLVGSPSWDLKAEVYAAMYQWCINLFPEINKSTITIYEIKMTPTI